MKTPEWNTSDYSILLNIIPLKPSRFHFRVYRKAFCGERRENFPGKCTKKSLPEISGDGKTERGDYWVSFDALKDFTEFKADSLDNRYLTQLHLFLLLKTKCEEQVGEGIRIQEGFQNRLFIPMEKFKEGMSGVWIEPAFISSQNCFGLLLNHHFLKDNDQPFNREVQRLSLSLDRNYRANRNFYLDKRKQLLDFLRGFYSIIFPLCDSNGNSFVLERHFARLPARTLLRKRYLVGKNAESLSQFQGVRSKGPLRSPETSVRFLFVYRPNDRTFAVNLLNALRGKTHRETFPGMSQMFDIPFGNDVIDGKEVADFAKPTATELCDLAVSAAPNRILPVILIRSKEDADDQRFYFLMKNIFSENGLPVQFVTISLLRNRNLLKWSIGNIGLQLFAKAGGKPWLVKPCNDETLIVGIGSAHAHEMQNGKRVTNRYYAYSVLTESSGNFKDLRFLTQTKDEKQYYSALRSRFTEVLKEYAGKYRHIVVHTPFKIRRAELQAIREVLEELRSDETLFLVLKVNSETKYFGFYDGGNSLVPFESTFVKLSKTEYLLWFEGLQYHNPNVARRYAGPAHLDFFYESHPLSDEERLSHMQDTLNLSGANWRGFNAKSLPVSIYYCKLIADFIAAFREHNLPEVDVAEITPWFL